MKKLLEIEEIEIKKDIVDLGIDIEIEEDIKIDIMIGIDIIGIKKMIVILNIDIEKLGLNQLIFALIVMDMVIGLMNVKCLVNLSK